MPQAVRFDRHGPVEVLDVVEVPTPTLLPDQVLVEVVAASINPGEIAIREGAMSTTAPSTFPSGQGSDLAGRIIEVGAQVDSWNMGDNVIGWTHERAAQAEMVAVPVDHLVAKPAEVPWEQAGALYVAGGTARGMADIVPSRAGDTVIVFGAAGGVGSILTQLLVLDGVRVLAVAGPSNDEWLQSVGAEPVNYGDGLEDRLREAAPDGMDAAYDAFGGGYVERAIGLGITADRVVTIIDFDEAKRLGATIVFGYQVATVDSIARLADLIASEKLTIPIAATFPLARVREAYTQLAERRTRGKIVLKVTAD